MGQMPNSLFDTIELCGVGQLAKHVPTENRSHRPLELQGKRLIVWNDKFIGGYATIRSDALLRAWNQGNIESDILTGKNAKSTEKLWPILNPIGTLRSIIRSRLKGDVGTALKGLNTQTPFTTALLRSKIDEFATNDAGNLRDGALQFVNSTNVSNPESGNLAKAWNSCLQDQDNLQKLEEIGLCNSLSRATNVSGDQVNVSLLVGVMNFHNINVSAQACVSEGTRNLAPKVTDDFKLKQRCFGALVSVCTVDNVNVFAEASLVRGAGPSFCLNKALRSFGTSKGIAVPQWL
jgi:hypothetical protein